MRPPKTTADNLRLIKQLYDEGKSVRQIASATGMNSSTVHYQLTQLKRRAMFGSLSTPKKKDGITLSKKAKAVIPKEVIVTRHTFQPPPYAPICTASMTEPYKGEELKYRR